MNAKSKVFWKGICLVIILGIIATFVTVGREPLKQFIDGLRHMGPIPFFTVLSICISFGLPPTPFLLVAGATFSFWTNITGLTFAFGISLTANYFFANRLFKTQFEHFLEQKASSLNHLIRQNTVIAVVIVRLTPGFPYILQNCLLASLCSNFALFFLGSLPPLLFIAMLYTAIGSGLVHANITLLVFPALALLGVFLAMRYCVLRKHR